MTSTELLVNTIIICLVVGIIIGAVLVDVLFAEPARKERSALLVAEARRRRIAAENDLGRAVFRRDHLGTPYIRTEDTALVSVDNDRWSRRAEHPTFDLADRSGLRSVQ